MVSSKRMIGCKTKKERRNGALRLAAAALAVGVIVPIARVDSLGTMKVYASSAVSTELAAQIAAYTEAAGAQSTGVDPHPQTSSQRLTAARLLLMPQPFRRRRQIRVFTRAPVQRTLPSDRLFRRTSP